MHVDLITLYLLAIGTLLASSGMTLWECRTHPARRQELKILAAGYATLALGCAMAAFRRELPGVLGSALSNGVMMIGYLVILDGVASFSRRRHVVFSVAVMVAVALMWVIGGTRWQDTVWIYVSAIPIAAVSGMTATELFRNEGLKWVQSLRIPALVASVHALFYAFRGFVLPELGAVYGANLLSVASKITMYEGVLYSVVLPMTLLRLVREEAHGQLLQESQTDYLTGLGNRRWFFEEGARAMREDGSTGAFALLAFDLDHFKAINDRYGHHMGDEVLKSFADIARGVLGAGAIFARIGGEEFVALLPRHDDLLAKAMGDRVVARFAQSTSDRTGGVEIRATVSIGLACSSSALSTLTDLLVAADRALYSAKALGGNRLEVARVRDDATTI